MGCPIGGSLEKRYQLPLFIGSPDIIDADLVAQVNFPGFNGHQVAGPRGAGEADADIESHSEYAVRIAGKSEGRIGCGEQDAAVDRIETIEHGIRDPVMQFTIAPGVFVDFQTQPLGEPVPPEHEGQDILRRWIRFCHKGTG